MKDKLGHDYGCGQTEEIAMPKTRCTITIDETVEGKLLIMANIPDRAEATIATQL